jgi:ABC-type phosphate/phosphonate transport system substrate-binding protein
MQRITKAFVLFIMSLGISAQVALAAEFSIGIMQDAPGVAQKYAPLIDLFKAKGLDVKLVGYRNYTDAAVKFANGEVDSMFAGSGVAGTMMIKDLAYPLVRPVGEEGHSTYWALILAPKGTPEFTGDPAYFKDKQIICSALASSGEFFARSILGKERKLLTAASHGTAIEALSRGAADVAIVKNRVWDKVKGQYPGLAVVGQDTGENPDNTLIVSFQTDRELVNRVKTILLNLDNDSSREADEVRKSLKVMKYIPTTEEDFSHTLALLKKAGVTPAFDFSY